MYYYAYLASSSDESKKVLVFTSENNREVSDFIDERIKEYIEISIIEEREMDKDGRRFFYHLYPFVGVYKNKRSAIIFQP